ncbi:MAG: hypothetical protein J6A75_09345 [Lachnospiraceae bacterium]|nr:hypothetical protein [Lachnospiraceae bacterium]
MEKVITAGAIIKKYIELRGKNIKEVAKELNIPYTTFSAKLNRDSIDVYLLFELNSLLDMDLNWMAGVLDRKRSNSTLDPLQIPRMKEEFRNHEKVCIEKQLKRIIKENPVGVADARNMILKEYHMFYLLDVLLPVDATILVINERNKEKYYCMNDRNDLSSRRHLAYSLIDGREMIDRLIAERK